MLKKNSPIKLMSYEEIMGVDNLEEVISIQIDKIIPFKNHPFKVVDDEKMDDLVKSIRVNGILTPVLVRRISNDEYEMISGHRRMHAATVTHLYAYTGVDATTLDAIGAGETTPTIFDWVRFANIVEDQGLEESIQHVVINLRLLRAILKSKQKHLYHLSIPD